MERAKVFWVLFSFAVMLAVFQCVSVFASWQDNGTPICLFAGNQGGQKITSDGLGGAIITWADNRRGQLDIYAQRVNSSGGIMWADTCVSICELGGDQFDPQIISDGSGGAIITWTDNRSGAGVSNSHIYVQRVDGSGNWLWTNSGVAVCTAAGGQTNPQLTSDGAGGAIITWYDHRISGSAHIFAQRVDGLGVVKWTTDGVAICTVTSGEYGPAITSDGSGGAIIAWDDYRVTSFDIYAQRVDGFGVTKWTTNGVAVCSAPDDQGAPQLISDGAGGAIITWDDLRGSYRDIYAQRVDALGVVKWTTNGVAICKAYEHQVRPCLTSDNVGGAIIAWTDSRVLEETHIYVQRVDALGVVKWTTNGVVVSTATGGESSPQLASDGVEGAIITWRDLQSGNGDIYAQRVDGSGNLKWASVGVAVCNAQGDQLGPVLTPDGTGGVIIAWEDTRNGNHDIYAQRVPAGMADVVLRPAAITALSQSFPNPFNPVTHITFSLAVAGDVSLRIYDIESRLVRSVVDGWREPGVYSEIWDGKDDDGSALPSGVYLYRLETDKFVTTKKMVLLK
jgi:hypothetical protein